MDERFHKEMMAEALRLAKENVLAGGGPFGAVVVRDGVIAGRGVNRVTQSNDPTAHAEVEAIREAGKNLNTFDLSGCVIYSSCEPCPMCLSAIYWANIEMLYYSATRYQAADAGFRDEFLYDEIAAEIGARKLPSVNIMNEESETPFNVWLSRDDRVNY